MPQNRRRVIDAHLSTLETFEQRQARLVAAAYRKARQEIVERLISTWPGGVTTPEQAVQLVRQLGLLQQIDMRLRQLEGEVGGILRGVVTSSSELAIENMRRELSLLPAEIRADFNQQALPFSQINHKMVERFLPVAVNDARLATSALSLQLQQELQTGLLQGQSFDQLVRRMMAVTPTGTGNAVWARGETSAMLMTRRTVIQAENGAKVEAIAEVERAIPEVQKQAIASMGPTTTDCCLRVHGQTQPVSQPFELTGEPRFADRIQYPPFHFNCRTSTAMWHPVMEESLPTSKLRDDARAELRRREDEPAKRGQRTA